MRLLVDENIHSDLVLWFRAQGHETLYAGESLKRKSDLELLELARTENRIVITDDLDFGELVFRSRLATQGVILLRLPGMQVAQRIDRLNAVWSTIESHLPGRFVVISPDRLRIRPLPSQSH